MINYEFDKPSEYMSVGDFTIPVDLELRAKAALAELEAVHQDFKRLQDEHEAKVREREDKFDEAMSHFQDTKDTWARVEDEYGNVHWVDVSYMNPPKKEVVWPFGDTSDFY